MVPKISYAFSLVDKKDYKHYLQQSFSLMTFFAAPMAVGLFIITPSFVPIFFGNEFLPVIPVLQILSSILFFVGLSNFFGIQVLATSGFESKLLISILLGAILNFILNLIFIPKYGSVGASFTSAFAELIIFFATFYMASRYAKVKINWIPVFQSLISTLPMFCIYLLLPNKLGIFNLIILIPFGILSYFLCQHLIFRNSIALELKNKFLYQFNNIFKWI
jgi:O-antigen/teichoic acid export membrane protein